MTYRPWDIILIPFPISQPNSIKKRPALVVSTETFNSGQDIVLMFLTSNLKSEPKIDDHLISNWKAAGLPKPTICRMKFATIDKSLIIKKLGRIQTADINTIKSKMKSFFHL
jgi:mRNA interferase MazF